MTEKIINGRIVQKHDLAENWSKATAFVPKKGEIIVYDKDSNYSYERIKIGDGSTLVNALPFVDDALRNDLVAQINAVDDKVDAVDALVGDTKVSKQISDAIAKITHPVTSVNSKTGAVTLAAADVGAVPTTRTVNGKALSSNITLAASDVGAAAASHGNHVPATETANNAKFLRNDNTWQTVTPANIGAAAASHGTHVSYSTTAPVMDGTASAGSASTVARSDHKHPTDTSRASASELATLQGLVGDKTVSEQIAAAQIVYVGPDMPTDPNIKVWINTSEEGTGIVPVLPRVATITLPKASWTGSASPYYQTVTVNTVTAGTKIDLQPTVTQITALQNADIALMAENNNGAVKVYSFGGKPSTDMTMQALLTEVSYV